MTTGFLGVNRRTKDIKYLLLLLAGNRNKTSPFLADKNIVDRKTTENNETTEDEKKIADKAKIIKLDIIELKKLVEMAVSNNKKDNNGEKKDNNGEKKDNNSEKKDEPRTFSGIIYDHMLIKRLSAVRDFLKGIIKSDLKPDPKWLAKYYKADADAAAGSSVCLIPADKLGSPYDTIVKKLVQKKDLEPTSNKLKEKSSEGTELTINGKRVRYHRFRYTCGLKSVFETKKKKSRKINENVVVAFEDFGDNLVAVCNAFLKNPKCKIKIEKLTEKQRLWENLSRENGVCMSMRKTLDMLGMKKCERESVLKTLVIDCLSYAESLKDYSQSYLVTHLKTLSEKLGVQSGDDDRVGVKPAMHKADGDSMATDKPANTCVDLDVDGVMKRTSDYLDELRREVAEIEQRKKERAEADEKKREDERRRRLVSERRAKAHAELEKLAVTTRDDLDDGSRGVDLRGLSTAECAEARRRELPDLLIRGLDAAKSFINGNLCKACDELLALAGRVGHMWAADYCGFAWYVNEAAVDFYAEPSGRWKAMERALELVFDELRQEGLQLDELTRKAYERALSDLRTKGSGNDELSDRVQVEGEAAVRNFAMLCGQSSLKVAFAGRLSGDAFQSARDILYHSGVERKICSASATVKFGVECGGRGSYTVDDWNLSLSEFMHWLEESGGIHLSSKRAGEFAYQLCDSCYRLMCVVFGDEAVKRKDEVGRLMVALNRERIYHYKKHKEASAKN